MAPELKDQIYCLMERGIQRVSAADIARQSALATSFPAKQARPGLRRWRTAGIAASAAAAACAAGLVAVQAGAGARPAQATAQHNGRAVLTAAMIRHLASASHLALAHTGEAVLHSRQCQDGVLQQTSTDHIRFSGKDWSDSFTLASPAADGQPASSESAINRVVGGQAYDYFTAADGLAWYHDTGPDAISSMHIPDPRKLLAELAPGAGFVKLGLGTIGDVQVEHLQATVLARLPAIQLPDLWKAGKLTALDVWVDGNGVVQQMSLTFAQTSYPGRAVHKRTGGDGTREGAPARAAEPQAPITKPAAKFHELPPPAVHTGPAHPNADCR